MDNIQLYYIDNEINKIDKMKQGDVIIRNLLAVLNSQNISIKQKAGTYFLILTHSLNIEEILSISLKRKDYLL